MEGLVPLALVGARSDGGDGTQSKVIKEGTPRNYLRFWHKKTAPFEGTAYLLRDSSATPFFGGIRHLERDFPELPFLLIRFTIAPKDSFALARGFRLFEYLMLFVSLWRGWWVSGLSSEGRFPL